MIGRRNDGLIKSGKDLPPLIDEHKAAINDRIIGELQYSDVFL